MSSKINRWKSIVSYLADGLTNKEIAARENITERTIRDYISKLFVANNLNGPACNRKLICMAIRNKLVIPRS